MCFISAFFYVKILWFTNVPRLLNAQHTAIASQMNGSVLGTQNLKGYMTFRYPSVYCDYRGSGQTFFHRNWVIFFHLSQHGHLIYMR